MAFRKDFVWGTATASYQIEGAVNEDGRTSSVWDTFSHTPGKVFGGHTGDVACDHYHRFREDVRLLKELGIKNYRFSLSWSRLLPEGTGALNPKGVDFYNALIDALGEAGIRPFVTLFHWDFPSILEDRGGFRNPESPAWFEHYATQCAKLFGDRVNDFITINEPQCYIGLGHTSGEHAPGYRLSPAEAVPAAHHLLRANGLAIDALRAYAPNAQVGYAPCGNAAIPVSERPEDIEAARKAYFSFNPDPLRWPFTVGFWSDPVILGGYPEEFLRAYGQYLPKSADKDMDAIHIKLDFYAQNIYNGDLFRAADNAAGFEKAPHPVGTPKTAINWFVTPEALYWGPKFLCERYQLPFYISENGMSCHDTVSLDGKVHDPNRIDYLNRYLLNYRRAADEGADIRGYFVWSFMDNFEWAMGYHDRFGIVYVDYESQQRTPKDSAYWYSEVIKNNGENL